MGVTIQDVPILNVKYARDERGLVLGKICISVHKIITGIYENEEKPQLSSYEFPFMIAIVCYLACTKLPLPMRAIEILNDH